MINGTYSFYCTLLSTLLLLQLTGCSGQRTDATEAVDTQFQASITKAQELQDKGSYALAELAARKAVNMEPEDKTANLVLFEALSEQSDPQLQTEAEGLAKKLVELFPADSPEAKAASSFIQNREAEVALKSLVEAFESKSPDTPKLLAEVPERVRNEKYWSLAYKIQRQNGDQKAQLAAAQAWLKFQPSGLDAKEAIAMVEADKLGLTVSPEKSFQVMRKRKSTDWKPFLVKSKGIQRQAEWLEQILQNSKVVAIKAQKGGLKVNLQLTHPKTQQSFPGTIDLAYKSTDGTHLLDLSSSSLTSGMKIFADANHTIRDDFWGINGIYKERKGYSSPILKPITRALGKGRYKEISTRLTAREKEIMGESSMSLGEALLYDNGQISVRVDKFTIDPNMGIAFDVDILSPKYRFANGLGVGSTVSDFSTVYKVEKVDAFKKRGVLGKINSPITEGGVIPEFGAYGVLNHKKNRAILLMTDRGGSVIAIRFKVESTRPEKGVF